MCFCFDLFWLDFEYVVFYKHLICDGAGVLQFAQAPLVLVTLVTLLVTYI